MTATPEVVETVARAIHKEDPTAWACGWPCSRSNHYRRLAAAAIAAMPPSPAEEAVKRVEALAAEHYKWARINRDMSFRFATERAREAENFHLGMAQAQEASARRLRAALASPAPAPQDWRQACLLGTPCHVVGRGALCSCDCPEHDQRAKTTEATARWNAHIKASR